jgi:hypothetical protein
MPRKQQVEEGHGPQTDGKGCKYLSGLEGVLLSSIFTDTISLFLLNRPNVCDTSVKLNVIGTRAAGVENVLLPWRCTLTYAARFCDMTKTKSL